jgi:EmrB/QacA subfamily drug resistance transporter
MCAAVALVMAMVTMVNTALPDLARSIGAGQAQQTWIVDAYTLVLAALVLPAGALGDRFGRRGVLIAGLALFALSCVIPLLADSSGWLITSRAVTGLGAALIMPSTLSIISASFPKDRRSRAIGVWAALAGLGGLLGVIASGLVLRHHSWHAVFVAPGATAVLLAVAAATVPTSRERRPRPPDLLGSALSALAVGSVVFGILTSAEHGWSDPRVAAALSSGVALGGLFVLVELRSADPLLDVRLFTDRRFALGALSVTLQLTAAYGAMFGLIPYLQLVRGYSPLGSGLALWPIALSMLPLALVSARLAERFGLRWVTVLGLGAVAAGLWLIGGLGPQDGGLPLNLGVVVLGAGIGLSTPAATTAIMDNAPPDRYGVASAVNDVTRELGSALGIALAGSLLATAYTHRVSAAAEHLPPAARSAADGSLAGALPVAAKLGPAGRALAESARSAFCHGLWLSATVLAGVVAAGALGLMFLRPRPPTAPPRDTPVSSDPSAKA